MMRANILAKHCKSVLKCGRRDRPEGLSTSKREP